tara:strand:- start:76 stop:462 length:387 start_codon:yes stop_codon:yes gene_type:complete
MDKDTKAMTQAEPSTEENQLAPASATGEETRKQQAIEILRGCYDPEIPVDIYELGLVYEINTESPESLDVKMTLTSPSCPVAESLPLEVESKLLGVPGVEKVNVEVVWDPTWTMDNMSEAAKLQLGLL